MKGKPVWGPSRETLRKVAKKLARIELGEEELAALERALVEIARPRELDIPEIEPATVFVA